MSLRQGDIVIDCADHEVVVPFWAGGPRLGAPRRQRAVRLAGAARRTSARPPARDRCRSSSRRSPSRRSSRTGSTSTGDPRIVSPRWPASRDLGATEIATRSLGDFTWTVMADPEGNEFCVS